MPDITFKAKPEPVYNVEDNSVAYRRVKVPKLGCRHCNMKSFDRDRNWGPYVNSDLFPGMLSRALKKAGIVEYIRLDAIPENVTVDTSGFLASVTISL